MGRRAAYLPSSVRSVGAMLSDGYLVTWHCSHGHSGPVDLEEVARRRGADFSLVDKQASCRRPNCDGRVYFRYAAGPGTPSRRLEALREREAAAQSASQTIDLVLHQLVQLHDLLARLYRKPTLKD